jgi:hypothetical protein
VIAKRESTSSCRCFVVVPQKLRGTHRHESRSSAPHAAIDAITIAIDSTLHLRLHV